VKHVPQALQRTAHGWLAEQQPLRSSRDIPLFRENGENDQEVEVCLTEMRSTHNNYSYYALELFIGKCEIAF
jgi:hypothetical protein